MAAGSGVGSVHGRCRVHRAEILRLRGASAEAEQEALAACAELRPYLRREFGWPLTELGRIRLQRGDLAGAEEAFLEARQAGWDPEPGLALVRMAEGDVALALASIRAALDQPLNVPSKECRRTVTCVGLRCWPPGSRSKWRPEISSLPATPPTTLPGWPLCTKAGP